MPLPELTPKQGFAIPPCSQHPPACPRGKPSPANHAMALLRSLQLLAIPDICVYSTTHNRVVFPGRAPSLPFSCCLPCVHLYIYIFFFQRRSGCCYFQHPPHVLEAIHALGHMAKTAEIFPVGPRRGFPSKRTLQCFKDSIPRAQPSTRGRCSTQSLLFTLHNPKALWRPRKQNKVIISSAIRFLRQNTLLVTTFMVLHEGNMTLLPDPLAKIHWTWTYTPNLSEQAVQPQPP